MARLPLNSSWPGASSSHYGHCGSHIIMLGLDPSITNLTSVVGFSRYFRPLRDDRCSGQSLPSRRRGPEHDAERVTTCQNENCWPGALKLVLARLDRATRINTMSKALARSAGP